MSAARWRQRLNPLHPILLRLEEQHFRARRYSKLIATTPEVRADLQHYFDVPADDVVIIPNGFSPTEFSAERRAASRESARSRFGVGPDDTVLLFVANELERKGYPTILAALRRLARPDVKLLVAGRVPVAQVKRMAADSAVSDQVIAVGSSDDVAGLHAAADVFILPTQYEAFCLAILEALGSGLPVITTRIPGAQDAVRHGENGLLVSDPRDADELTQAIRQMLDADVRQRLGFAAAPSVQQYKWPSVLTRFEQVLLENARPAAAKPELPVPTGAREART
jgi:UDP-glucose:(heptosyl)LPS alpha-1,3-glucosyltransferase